MSDLDRSIERLKRNIAVGGYDGGEMTGMFRTIDDLVGEHARYKAALEMIAAPLDSDDKSCSAEELYVRVARIALGGEHG